ncbi:Aldo/keto reductase [Paenibacillus sp. yr247]|uniref:aldo/keto reductase n=1 Tax=Paenibacillus sp. yr247 TaxID=1761880 RepID=UPI0008915244|nr:aldo/keto reductase [Paenibacillus sp. yr247]SDP03587.1 Aldo/keto reductase [Paenibacillus sp. yr247]
MTTEGANRAFSSGPRLNNGITMPWIGLGVFLVREGNEVIHSVKSAIGAGYRSIDTASVYGNEQGVGQAIRESGVPREELFVTTKVWNADQGYESTLKAYEVSRKKLGLEAIDLYLIHWLVKGKYRETWKALVHLYQEGHVRAIGVSNFQIHNLREIIEDTGVVPAVNQVEYHPRLVQRELLTFCREQGIQLQAYAPLMHGHLDHPVLARLATKYGKTMAQIILRWDIQNGIVTIPKSVNPERIRQNANVFDFELSEEDMATIDALDEGLRYGPHPDHFNR